MDERRKEKRSVIVVGEGEGGDVVNLGNARDGPVARQPKPVIIGHHSGGSRVVVVVVAVTAPRSASPTTMFYLFLGRARDERKKRRKEKRREERRGIRRRDLSPRFLSVRCIARVLCTFSPLPGRQGGRVLRSFNGDRI